MSLLVIVFLMCNVQTEQCTNLGTISINEVSNAQQCEDISEEMNAEYSKVWMKSLEGNVFGFQTYCDTKI